MAIEREFDPDREPSHPGSIIRDYMEAEGLNQSQLAKALDLSRPYLNKIINGKAGLSEKIAIRLAKVFETSAEFWADLSTKRKLWEARQDEDQIREETPAVGAGNYLASSRVRFVTDLEFSEKGYLKLVGPERTEEMIQETAPGLEGLIFTVLQEETTDPEYIYQEWLQISSSSEAEGRNEYQRLTERGSASTS